MKFEMTNETLNNLQKQETVTLSDMLGIFKDVINDIKGAGTLSEIGTGDAEQAVVLLASVTRSLMSLSKNNIDAEELSDSKQKKLGEMTEHLAELNDNIRSCENSVNDIKYRSEQLEKRKTELAAAAEKLQIEYRKVTELEEECSRLNDENEHLKTLSIPEALLKKEYLENKLAEAEKELADSNAECDELRRKLGECGERTSAAGAELTALKQSIAASNEQYQLLTAEIEKQKSVLAERSSAVSEAQRHLDAYLESIKQFDLPDNRRTYDRAKAKIAALKNLSAGLEETLGLGDFVEHYADYAADIRQRTQALEDSANSLKATYFTYIENMEKQLSEFEKETLS
ncbi:MAG: hypothetical protein IK093_11780 [Ruminiclostridium sp.]|nr:hypothetical protein [Ruminiclostridium sp.]